MTRSMECKRTNEDGAVVIAHDLECTHSVKPATYASCNGDMPCTNWLVKYGECSLKCGGGLSFSIEFHAPNTSILHKSKLKTLFHLPRYLKSYHIISNHIKSYHITSYHIISYFKGITSYQIISNHITSHPITSYHISKVSHHIKLYQIISHHIISYIYHIYIIVYISSNKQESDEAVSFPALCRYSRRLQSRRLPFMNPITMVKIGKCVENTSFFTNSNS